jgi:hypothetical protein
LSPSRAAASFTGFNQDELTRRDKMRKITFFDQFLIIEAWAGEHCWKRDTRGKFTFTKKQNYHIEWNVKIF